MLARGVVRMASDAQTLRMCACNVRACNVYAYVRSAQERSREQTRHEERTTTTTVSLLLFR